MRYIRLLSRVSTALLTRDIDIGILFVRPSVCPSRSRIVSKRLNIVTVSSPHCSRIILQCNFVNVKPLREIPTGLPHAGALNTGGV